MKLLDLYNSSPYEPLVPESIDQSKMVYKFNSPQHYISYMQGLHELGRGGQSTQKSSEEGDFYFTLSHSLADAYDVIREVKFDPRQTDLLQAKIAELKRNSHYSDEGYELEIPEYLAGGSNIWLRQKPKTRPTKIIDDILLSDSCYNAACSSEVTKEIGMGILTSIYRRNVIPRKVVVVYTNRGLRNNSGGRDFLCAIDVNFNDLNGIAKMLHPSSFRRLFFRLNEIFPDLSYGYGHAYNGSTEKGYISIETVYHQWNKEKQDCLDGEVNKFLGLAK